MMQHKRQAEALEQRLSVRFDKGCNPDELVAPAWVEVSLPHCRAVRSRSIVGDGDGKDLRVTFDSSDLYLGLQDVTEEQIGRAILSALGPNWEGCRIAVESIRRRR